MMLQAKFCIVFFSLLATLDVLAQQDRKWERKLEEIDISATPEGRLVPGNEKATKQITISGKIGTHAGGPFIAFSAGWNEDGTGTQNSALRISSSKDSIEWSPWIEVPTDMHANEARWESCTELRFLPADARYYRISVESNLLGQGKIMRKLFLNFFDPGKKAAPSPTVQEMNSSSACPCDKPLLINRAGWNCPQTNNPGYGYTNVTHLIVHHSAGANTSSDWAAVVLSIWNSHVNTNGWADIGYNYLIDPQGRLYEGRGGGDNVTGAHFCGTNGGTMGVCMLGTYTSVSIPDTARKMLTRILAWKACSSGIDPTASSWHTSSQRTLNHISGHRDGCATECPGTRTYTELPDLRTAVANLINACSSPTSVQEVPGLRGFRVRPNPIGDAKAWAEFDLASSKRFSYEVYASDGRLIYASPPKSIVGRNTIRLEGLERLTAGHAFVVFRMDKWSFTQRLVLQ